MGTYGFVRFSLPMFPDAVKDTASLNLSYATFGLVDYQFGLLHLMVFLSIVGLVYGALVAMMQKDAKKLVAYSSVSHLGFCMLGLFALNPNGINGSIIQQINHGISTGALFFLVGMIYERRHSRLIDAYGGIARVVPLFAAILTIVSLSSIGLPGTNGFVGEFLVLLGAFRTYPVAAALATTGVIIAAAYLLWALQRVLFNPLDKHENEKLTDLTPRELAVLIPLLVCIVWIGVYPKPFLTRMEPAARQLIEQVRPK
jgi:NADH-quinone oxidoreductase subunit M